MIWGKYDLYNMYVNRDPRFYASLTFQERNSEMLLRGWNVAIILLIGEIWNIIHIGG